MLHFHMAVHQNDCTDNKQNYLCLREKSGGLLGVEQCRNVSLQNAIRKSGL
jgi:hypothetical protein